MPSLLSHSGARNPAETPPGIRERTANQHKAAAPHKTQHLSISENHRFEQAPRRKAVTKLERMALALGSLLQLQNGRHVFPEISYTGFGYVPEHPVLSKRISSPNVFLATQQAGDASMIKNPGKVAGLLYLAGSIPGFFALFMFQAS
jgi:hypothetical protein